MSLELLTTATGTLRREYMARLEVARAELLRRAAELGERRAEQERLLQRLERERIKARDEAEALSERYEDVKDRGQELGARVEAVLSKLQVYYIIFYRAHFSQTRRFKIQYLVTFCDKLSRPKSPSCQTRSWQWPGRSLASTGRCRLWREE